MSDCQVVAASWAAECSCGWRSTPTRYSGEAEQSAARHVCDPSERVRAVVREWRREWQGIEGREDMMALLAEVEDAL